MPNPANRLLKWLRGLLALLLSTLAAQAAVLPLMTHHFGNLPLSGILANIPIGIMASISTCLGIAFYFAAILGDWAVGPISFLLERLFAVLFPTLKFFASLPYSNIRVASPGWPAMFLIWAIFYFIFEASIARRVSRRAVIAILALGNFLLWAGLLVERPDWRLEFLDLGQNRAWLFTSKEHTTVASFDSYSTRTDAADVIISNILNRRGGRLEILFSATPDSSEVRKVAEEFSLCESHLTFGIRFLKCFVSSRLEHVAYDSSGNFTPAVKVIWDQSDNKGGGKDSLPICQIDLGDGRILLAGQIGAGILDCIVDQRRLIALELPWSEYARSSCLDAIRMHKPEVLVFSPDQYSAHMPRSRRQLTHSAANILATSITGSFAISGFGRRVKIEAMRPNTFAGD